VFKQSAPVIKLPAGATEDEHLALLGLLNSSTAVLLDEQVFHNKVYEDRRGHQQLLTGSQFFEFEFHKIKLFPIVEHAEKARPYAAALDRLHERAPRIPFPALGGQSRLDEYGSAGRRLAERRTRDRDDLFLMGASRKNSTGSPYGLTVLMRRPRSLSPTRSYPIRRPGYRGA